VILGLLLAIPLVQWSASPAAGLWLRRMRLLLVPEETSAPDILLRANALAVEFAQETKPGSAFLRLFADRSLTEVHCALLPAAQTRKRGEVDITLVVALAKLDDCAALVEADDLLTRSEKMAVLCDPRGFERLAQLARA
jgi:membrane glycosyltransferase